MAAVQTAALAPGPDHQQQQQHNLAAPPGGQCHYEINKPFILHINCTENYAPYLRVYDVSIVLYVHTGQYRRCTYNVILRHVRATIVVVEK
jgi:hypothetical protein